MRSLMALSLLLASTASVMSAEIKATSRIDAVTVYPAGAEVTRIGRVTMEGGEHVILFTDLPAQAVSGSIRVEGKATGTLADRLGRHAARFGAAHRRGDRGHRAQADRRCDREAEGRARRAAGRRRGRAGPEGAGQQSGAAADADALAACRGNAARLVAALHPDRPAQSPRRRRPFSKRRSRCARPTARSPTSRASCAIGARPGAAHRGEGVRQRDRRARCRSHHPLSGGHRIVDAVL